MEIRWFTGRLQGGEAFLMSAGDEIDAGRYATACLGDVEPGSLREAPPAEGVGVAFAWERAGPRPTRMTPVAALAAAPAAP